jgi:hypothetical protein
MSVVVSGYAQNADFRNWKRIEEEMFRFVQRLIELANSPEWREKGMTTIEATSNNGAIKCEYDINEKSGFIYYGEPSISYSIESGFYYDLYNTMGSPSVTTSGTDVYNTWRNVSRWFYSARRILFTGKTIVILYFNIENINKYGYK